jgi:hypothetical protein
MGDGERTTLPDLHRVLELARGFSAISISMWCSSGWLGPRDLSDARYAALGVLDRSRTELERFIIIGGDEVTRRRIDALPRGCGVLGELIANPVPLWVGDSGAHPHSGGLPVEQPRHFWGFR